MSRQLATQIQQQKPSTTHTVSRLLQRQCACGNHTMAGGECEKCRRKKKIGLQTKLRINEPGDMYEQEADRIAERVLAAPAHSIVGGAPLRIQRYFSQASGQVDTAPENVNRVLASPGKPLEPVVQQDMQHRFGHDFSLVRVHSGTDAEQSATEVNANAYTVGNNIVFGAGRFTPGTHEGRRLIAHELTHVVQQSGGNETRAGQKNESGLSPVYAQCTRGGEAVIQRDETDEERRRRATFGDLSLSPEVAASWGMPSPPPGALKASSASPATNNAHHSQMPPRNPQLGLPRTVKTISVLHFGTFGEHYVIAQLKEPSIQTEPDPVAGINFDTYIVSPTRMIAAKALGGTLYQVFMGSAECPGCHFGRGLVVDIGGENPIIATLPHVLAALVPNPEGGPPPKQGIGVRLVKTGPSRPYDPNPVGPARPPARQLTQRERPPVTSPERQLTQGEKPPATPPSLQLREPIGFGKKAEGPIIRRHYPDATTLPEDFPAYDGIRGGKRKFTGKLESISKTKGKAWVVEEMIEGGEAISIKTFTKEKPQPKDVARATDDALKDIANKGESASRRHPDPLPDGSYWRVTITKKPDKVILHLQLTEAPTEEMISAAKKVVAKTDYGDGWAKVEVRLKGPAD